MLSHSQPPLADGGACPLPPRPSHSPTTMMAVMTGQCGSVSRLYVN